MKPSNILLSADYKTVKLCDFGLARIKTTVAATATVGNRQGTPLFMAPEIMINKKRPNFDTDVWAMGGTIAELYSCSDFWDLSEAEDYYDFILKKMKKKNLPDGFKALKDANEDVHQKLQDVFAYTPKNRPSAKVLHQRF